jgi:hypothetical protein
VSEIAVTNAARPRPASIRASISAHRDLAAAAVVMMGLGWRLWLAHATFFNTDEAWHYTLSKQPSLLLAYRASLTINHPPLLILLLHFWRHLGTSNLSLRLPSVIAGTLFCWLFYRWLKLAAGEAAAWAGLVLATFLPPMIAMSADLRQYPLLLMFMAGAAYFLERALDEDSPRAMIGSSLCLYGAMLSHYSAFFIAAGLGVYALMRMWRRKPGFSVLCAWVAGQGAGVTLAIFLYKTHIARLRSLVTQSIIPQNYLAEFYFHPGKEHLLTFLYRGTFGIFRFAFGQTQIGQIAAVLFLAGIVFLFLCIGSEKAAGRSRALGILLLLPFLLNWLAVVAGTYPYGRMRQCVYLGVFGIAGVCVCLAKLAREKPLPSAAAALGIVVLCHAFGKPQDRDMLPLAEQRHEHMDQALEFMHARIKPADIILTDRATAFQLRRYLCGNQLEEAAHSPAGFDLFECGGVRFASTGANDGALSADNLISRSKQLSEAYVVRSDGLWIVQGGWASGLGEALRQQVPAYSNLQIHNFGKYLEVFRFPVSVITPAQSYN